MSRRATLSGQGSSLLTFAGVIQTILVAPLIAFATNPQAKTLLQANPNIHLIEVLFGMGFAAYILTIALGILAFRETKWIPAPQVLSSTDPKQWRAEFDQFNDDKNPKEVPIAMYEMQLMEAITKHQSTNNRKYNLLMAGFISLFVGITLTVFGGYLLLLGSI